MRGATLSRPPHPWLQPTLERQQGAPANPVVPDPFPHPGCILSCFQYFLNPILPPTTIFCLAWILILKIIIHRIVEPQNKSGLPPGGGYFKSEECRTLNDALESCMTKRAAPGIDA